MGSPVTLKGSLLFPSKYLSHVDLQGKDFTLTIEHVNVDELQMVGGKKEKKPLVSFKGAQKKLVLNKTNATIIADLYGNEVTGWFGKRITLYPTTCRFGANTEKCIRVREAVPPASKNDAAMAAQDPPPAEFGVPDEAFEAVSQ